MPEGIFVQNFLIFGMLFFILILTLLIIFSGNLIRSVIFLTMYSLVMALLYLLLAAPDVAMTEAAIGACISTIFFLTILPVCEDKNLRQKINLPALIICCAVAGVIIYSVLGLPEFGNKNSIPNLVVSPYYNTHTAKDMGITNIVTAVLAGYRSYDTLGETYVIFTAAIAVLAIFGSKKSRFRDY